MKKYIKICPKCGSINIKIPPAGMDIKMTMKDYCEDCKNIGNFPEVKEAEIKLRKMNFQIVKYMKAVELYMNGLSLYKIAKELNIQYSTAKNWLKVNKHLPTLFQEEGDFLAEV